MKVKFKASIEDHELYTVLESLACMIAFIPYQNRMDDLFISYYESLIYSLIQILDHLCTGYRYDNISSWYPSYRYILRY